MNFQTFKRKRFVISAAAFSVLLLSQPALAIFGLGDIVTDPGAYIRMALQSTQLGQIIASSLQLLTVTRQAYNTLNSEYNQIVYNAKQFSNKTYWRTFGVQAINTTTANTYGETRTWDKTVNGAGAINSTAAWNQSTISLKNNPWLATEPLGNSSQLATVATAEISGSASRAALDTLGATAQAQTASDAALSTLERLALDGSPGTNSEIQQLNLINGGAMLNLHNMQTLIALQKANLQLNLANAKIQHDKAAAVANFFADYDGEIVSTPADWGNAAQAYQGEVIP